MSDLVIFSFLGIMILIQIKSYIVQNHILRAIEVWSRYSDEVLDSEFYDSDNWSKFRDLYLEYRGGTMDHLKMILHPFKWTFNTCFPNYIDRCDVLLKKLRKQVL